MIDSGRITINTGRPGPLLPHFRGLLDGVEYKFLDCIPPSHSQKGRAGHWVRMALHVARSRERMSLQDRVGSAWHCMSRGCAAQYAVRPTCRKVERGVTNVSGSARAVASRTKITVGRRCATAGSPPGDTDLRAGYCPFLLRPPDPWSWATALTLGTLEPLYPPSDCLSDGPASAARRRGRAPPGPPTRHHSTEAGLRATPAPPRAPKPSLWNDQRTRSWPL